MHLVGLQLPHQQVWGQIKVPVFLQIAGWMEAESCYCLERAEYDSPWVTLLVSIEGGNYPIGRRNNIK